MPKHYYYTEPHQQPHAKAIVAVKPHVVPYAKRLANDREIPMIKLLTDLIEDAYKKNYQS